VQIFPTSSKSSSRMTSSAFPVAPSPSLSGISQESRTIYLSNTISSLIGCIIPIIALIYLSALSLVYRYAQRNPRPLNKSSGVRVQRYAPSTFRCIFYACTPRVLIISHSCVHFCRLQQSRRGACLPATFTCRKRRGSIVMVPFAVGSCNLATPSVSIPPQLPEHRGPHRNYLTPVIRRDILRLRIVLTFFQVLCILDGGHSRCLFDPLCPPYLVQAPCVISGCTSHLGLRDLGAVDRWSRTPKRSYPVGSSQRSMFRHCLLRTNPIAFRYAALTYLLSMTLI
jgi:hypothetical protein